MKCLRCPDEVDQAIIDSAARLQASRGVEVKAPTVCTLCVFEAIMCGVDLDPDGLTRSTSAPIPPEKP